MSAKFLSNRLAGPWSVLSLLVLTAGSAAIAPAQTTPDADSSVVLSDSTRAMSPAELKEAAWVLLTNAVTDMKHPDSRVQGLAALGLLGGDARSIKMMDVAMVDHDIDVRIAAALAAGQTKSPSVTTGLREMLDDKEPPVAFAAAVTLWKMGDRSGEDILMAVADGDRGASSSAFNSATHAVNRDLHHPGSLARFGAMQGAGMLLGPFGYGISAYEYLHKNGGDAARVTAIESLAENHTIPIRLTLVAALTDKDPGVRAASAKALRDYHEPETSAAIAKLFLDEKPPVRYTAAAAYLLSTGSVAAPAGTHLPRRVRTPSSKK